MTIGAIQSSTAYQSSALGGANASSMNQNQDFQATLEDRIAEMEEAVASGEINVSELQTELQERFGEDVDEAFSEDGGVDFGKLEEIIQEEMASGPQGMHGPPPGGPPPGPPPGEGEDEELITDAESMQSKLMEMFGEDAEGVVDEDGEIDAEKLKALVEEKLSEESENTYSSPFTNDSYSLNTSSVMNAAFVNLRA